MTRLFKLPRARWLACLCLSLLLAGCGDPEGDGVSSADPPGFTLADSAGFTIVTNTAPMWEEEDAWEVGSEPILSIGGAASDEDHLIWRVQGAGRMSGGGIAVLVGGSVAPRVLVFGPDGQLLRSIGRSGQGPGEFMEPHIFQHHPGDSLSVWERFYGRITTFDSLGSILSTRRPDIDRVRSALHSGGGSRVVLPLPDGSFIVRAEHPQMPRDLRPVRTWFREPVEYLRVKPDYTVDTLGTFAGFTQGYESPGDMMPLPSLGGEDSSVAASDHGDGITIYISNGDDNVVRVFDEAGHLQRLVRKDVPPTPMSDAERQAAVQRFARNNNLDSDGIAHYERLLLGFPERTHPPMRFMHVDRLGHLWTLNKLDSQNRSVWDVFDTEGVWLTTLAVPLFPIFDIGSDFILGVKSDDLRIESIHVYPLSRTLP